MQRSSVVFVALRGREHNLDKEGIDNGSAMLKCSRRRGVHVREHCKLCTGITEKISSIAVLY
jgi:hypothetical protein